MDASPLWQWAGTLLQGLVITLQVTLGAALLAIVAALIVGLGRVSRWRTLRALSRIYVEVLRGTSALVQLYWVYFALPLAGIEIGALASGIAVLGLNTGAYGAEIVRGALQAVPPGQREAARALNLSERQTLWRVILPQAVPAMLPPASNLLVELLKNTALVSTITLADLTFQGQLLRAATLRSGEIFGIVLVLYFVFASGLVGGVRWLERALSRGQDRAGAVS